MSYDDYQDMEESRVLRDLSPTRALVGPVDTDTRARHLVAINKAASELRSVATPFERPTRHRPSVQKLTAATMAASLSLVGLASAQVDLSKAISHSVSAVGAAELPDLDPEGPPTDRGKSPSDDVRGVIEGSDGRGCDFGETVSDAASQNAQGEGPAQDPCKVDVQTTEASDGESRGRSEARGENAGTHNDKGQARADQASATGQDHQADDAPLGGENSGTHNDQGQATAEEKSSTGKETGETHSEQGQSHKPDQPGKP